MDTVRLRRRYATKVGFSERLSRSLEYLNFKARSHNAIASYELVERVLSEQRKYAMYREMFPKERKRSRASLYSRGYYSKYSERVNELFSLVNENCFPLLEFAYDDPENEFEQFAIPPMNVDLCCEDIYFENLKVSYSAALIFYFPDDAWDFLNQKYKVSRSDFCEINSDPHPNVWDRKNCSLLGELLRLVDHSTGNPWLDSNYCQYREANRVFERLEDSGRAAQIG